MTRIRRINQSQVEGSDANQDDDDEIRPYGEIAVYVGDNNKLELLMFDGVRTHVRSKVLNKGTFYGGDADSADGAGYDSIKLVPDEELRRSGSQQYIIVEPTGGEPGHVHIRAGGTIDSSTADLFLGGEKNNVRVSDTNDRVTITTDFGVDGQTRTWTFNNNGGLQLPGSSNGLIGESEPGVVVFSDLGFAVVTNANTESTNSWIFGTNGILTLPYNNYLETINTNLNVGSGGAVTIRSNAASNLTTKEWQFGDDGTTTFPDDKIKCPISDSISIETEILPTAPPATIVISGADFSPVNLTYIKDPYDPNWFPANYSSLTDPHITYHDSQWKILVPGFGQALYVNTGTINVPLAQWNTNPPLGSVAPTGVYTYTDTYTRTWQFGSNGNLTLPNNSTISDTPAVAQYSSSFSMGAYADTGTAGNFTARTDFHYTANPLINTVTVGWFVSGPGLIGVKEIIAKTAIGEPGDWAITVDLTDGSTWPFDESSYTFYSPDYQIVPAGSTLTVNSNEWKFGANSSLTFPDGSTYNNSRLTGAVDSDIELEVKHRTTVSAEAFHGGVDDLIFDISENDDITVVQPGWELNVGSELAPIWATVAQASIDQSGNYEIRFSEDYNFEDFTTYTFRNPTPVSKVWTINNQNGTLIAPGNAILSNETADLGGGNTYRDFSIELPTPDGTNEQRWTFSNDGRTTFPNGTVPEHSYGADGDKEGMVVFTDPYIYYCKQDYVDNTTDIWVRVAWTGTNW
jgi:hypothetical protein